MLPMFWNAILHHDRLSVSFPAAMVCFSEPGESAKVTNGAATRMSDMPRDKRQPEPNERRQAPLVQDLPRTSDRSKSTWRTFVGVSVAFWAVWYVAYSVFVWVNTPLKFWEYLFPRSLLAVVGVLISLGVAFALQIFRPRRVALGALVVIPLALVATGLHAIASDLVWRFFYPDEMGTSPPWIMYTTDFIIRFWYFASVSALMLAVSYIGEIKDREQQITQLQALAHSAQLRALRNQLHPHFLFNALNSIIALLSRRRGPEAGTMTENLADFLRETLALDPQKLITLGEEIRLQQLYLAIERVRFPDRLNVSIDVPDELMQVLVPSLITQPLIENSIKYAVARSTEPVDLRIGASSSDGMLELVLEDSGGNAEGGASKGDRVGLANVSERLAAHYGSSASFESGGKPDGGFRNTLRLPVTTK
jgi:two-component system LytT family sensor kinase